MDVHSAEFRTPVKFGEHFPRIEQSIGVESAFYTLLMIEIVLSEHFWHQIALLDTDAMFTGQYAAYFDA